jgi:hypothetical protein
LNRCSRYQAIAVDSPSSFWATHDGATDAADLRRYAFEESAIVTKAAPIMIASLMTNRPAPLR